MEESTDTFSAALLGFRSCVSQEFRIFFPDFLEALTEQDSDSFPVDQ